MPTYEYVCEACGHDFDQFQKMTEPRLTKCPKCGKEKLRRKIGTGAGVIFKGAGFYCNDYHTANASCGPACGCGHHDHGKK